MPYTAQDTIGQRIESVVQKLRALSDQSASSQAALTNLERILDTIGSVNLGNLERSVEILAQFNRNLALMPGGAEAIKEVQQETQELVRTMAELNTQMENRAARVNLGTQQEVINRVKAVPGFRRTAEQNIDLREAERLSPNLVEQAQRTRADLTRAEQTSEENVRIAERWSTNQHSLLRTLVATNRDIERLGNAYTSETRTINQDTRSLLTRLSLPLQEGQLGTNAADLLSQTGAGETAKKSTTTMVDFTKGTAFGNLKEIGLSSTAIKNLTEQLSKLGITSAEVSKPVTELSTGITTVTMVSEKAGMATQRYTAHIDNAGNILQDTQKRFRSFGSAIMRDTVEVLKWTIAISLIYTPIRKVSEMLEQAKQIQLDLVDVQIALGSSTRSLGEIFETTADIATQTSSAIEGVIEGYSLAVAASASAGSEFQRSATTTALLKDSMILSKLANIEQKEALDILVGAMSQLGLGLTQGTQLLDSWVAVSKKANVSINQLATSFAIVGSAAEEVGLGYNELNALVGTLAQSTTLSANEVGNAIRGIIAAMQTDKAQAEFAKYGIATKTLNGDFRDFMEILRDMKVMQQGGILDEKAMAALTQAGGAGARRGAQLSALVQNLGTAFELITVSQQASGEAAAAMELEMSTLDAAATRLNNSFAMLAQTLGGEGGVLSFMTGVTNAATGLVNVMRTLVSIMKGAAPVLATMILLRGAAGTASGAKILGGTIPTFLQQMLSPQIGGTGIDSRIFTSSGLGRGGGISGRGPVGGFAPLTNALLLALQRTGVGVNRADNRAATYGEMLGGVGTFMRRPLFGGYLGKANLMSMLGPAAVLSSNIGKPAEEAAPRAVLGGLFALPGIIAGNPVWSTIGSVIATGFYDEFMTFTDDIAQSWAKWRTEVETNAPAAPGTREDLLEQLDKQIKGTLTLDQKLGINLYKWILNAGKVINPQKMAGMPNVGEAETLLGLYLNNGKTVFGNNPILTPEQMNLIGDMLSEFLLQQAQMGLVTSATIPTTELESDIIGQIQQLSSFAADASAEMMQIALDDIAKGAPGAIQNYLNLQSIAQSYASVAGNLLVAQTAVAETAAPGAMANVPQFNQITAVDFVSKLNTEELNMVSTLLTQINSGQIAYDKAIAEGRNVTAEEKKSLDDLALSIQTAKEQYLQIIPAIQSAIDMRIVESKLLTTVEVPEGITPEQRQAILTAAETLWRQVFEASGIPKEVIDNYIANQKQQIITANGQIIAGAFTNIPQQYINQAATNMNIPMTPQPLNLQNQPDLSMAQIPALLARYYQALNAIKANFPTYESETEPVGFILKDGFYQTDLDLKILGMVMNDLLDETKKQGLQGIYNLPEGATFMIPVTAFELDRQTRAEGTGGGGWGPNPFENYPTTPPEEKEPTTPAGQSYMDWIFNRIQQPPEGPPVPTTAAPQQDQLNQIGEDIRQSLEPLGTAGGAYSGLATTTGEVPSWLETLSQAVTNFSTGVADFVSGLIFLLPGMREPPGASPEDTSTQGNIPSTNLNLAVDSTITLTVDGRTLATIVKPFLYQDLIRYMTSANSSVNRSVVG